jgi:hypothetical protein
VEEVMSTGLIEIIKVAAMDAVENSKPCEFKFGTVVSVKPLKVQITNDLILPESVLIVPQHLTDYTVSISGGGNAATSISVEGNTLFVKESEPTDESNTTTITVHNALTIGDHVALIRNQGGKTYYILSRIRW